MKKTINANLGNRIFYVEEDAYPVLETYLSEVKAHFEKFQDNEEILTDIETRIAEQLAGTSKDLQPIVDLEAVQRVIQAMGNPTDFIETEEGLAEKPSHTNKSAEAKKRFYRSTENVIIGGVSSGIASYFDIDPLWIRLAFVFTTITGGYGVLIYIVLWIIIPAAETPSQKLEMKGNRLTLRAFEQSVKEKIGDDGSVKKHASRAGGMLREIVLGIGKLIKRFGGTIVRIIGAVLAIGMSFAIIGLLVSSVGIAFGGSSPHIEFPLRDFFGTGLLYIVVLIGFCIAFIPLIFGLTAGVSLAALKNKFNPISTVALLILWGLALTGGAAIAARNAPRMKEFLETHPSFKTETKSQTIGSFTKLIVGNDIRVTLEPGTVNQLDIKTLAKDQGQIKAEVQNGSLIITRNENRSDDWCLFCIQKTPEVTIIAPLPGSIEASNSVRITGEGFTTDILRLSLINGSRATLSLRASEIHIATDNSSRASLSGEADTFEIRAKNASRIHALDLISKKVLVEASNSSSISVHAVEKLVVKVGNSSYLRYGGNPTDVDVVGTNIENLDQEEWGNPNPLYTPELPTEIQ